MSIAEISIDQIMSSAGTLVGILAVIVSALWIVAKQKTEGAITRTKLAYTDAKVDEIRDEQKEHLAIIQGHSQSINAVELQIKSLEESVRNGHNG